MGFGETFKNTIMSRSNSNITLIIIVLVCLLYIYNPNKDTYVYISIIFLYSFIMMIPHEAISPRVRYALAIPMILNIVGLMLAYKSSDTNRVDNDLYVMKSFVISCFVFISAIILLSYEQVSVNVLYVILFVLYILSFCVVYYANSSNTKMKNATG